MTRRGPGNGTAFGARTATWLLIAFGLALLAILGSMLGLIAPIQNVALTVLGPAQAAVSSMTDPIDDFFDHFGEFGTLESENAALRDENERLSIEIARLREAEAAYADLSEIVDVTESRPDDTFLAASVVARSAARFEKAIAIDRGSADGVVEGMVVLSPKGSVVGRVSAVLSDYSWVTLLNDPTSHIPAIVQDTRFDGILSGHQDGGMRLEMLPNAASVEAGDTIVTSGLNGELPKGLPLGRVIEVGGSDQDPFPSVFVEPLTALDRLEHLVVLTSFRPGGIPDAESIEEAAPEQGALAAADATQTEEATAQPGEGAEQRPDESRLPGSGQ